MVRRRLVFASVTAALVGLAATGAATPAVSATCRPTVALGGGPFERSGAPAPRRSRIGTGHVLTGRILSYPGCRPLRAAVVEFWQESPNGVYDRRGRAAVVTGRFGTFRFEGPVPPGGSFGPHIHIHVSAAGFDDFVTTYRLARGERQGRIQIVLVSSL